MPKAQLNTPAAAEAFTGQPVLPPSNEAAASRTVVTFCMGLGLSMAMGSAALAQGHCTSEGIARPTALVERFINADCEACWGDPATPVPPQRAMVLDWIVPGSQGEEAPLSAAATRDSITRLQSLGQPEPARTAQRQARVEPSSAVRLRVAQGPAVNQYLGASVRLQPVPPPAVRQGGWRAWLALVEQVPAGEAGTPVARQLVRGLLEPPWSGRDKLSGEDLRRLSESRVMSIPEGAQAERLRIVGWVEDAQGRVLAATQTRCVPAP
jgi:hypothetical protein